MTETLLKVTGMNCGACVNHVTNALKGVDGVQSAQVDLDTGIAKVHHDDSATPETLIAAVIDDGYDAQTLSAP